MTRLDKVKKVTKQQPKVKLKILVAPSIDHWFDREEWGAKGYVVHNLPILGIWEYDIIMGPKCWRMLDEFQNELEHALKAAIKARRGNS